MGSSLSAGLAGLRAHQQYIDVVGNNISNANTPGYKGQRALFAELLSQTLRPANGPGGTIGGTNPMQIGLGVQMAAVATDAGQGGFTATGRTFDLAIEGKGFFATQKLGQRLYTRVGTFAFDSNQDLVDLRTGFKVLSSVGSPIQIDAGQIVPAQATTKIDFQGNLPAVVTGPKAEVLASAAPFLVETTLVPATAATGLNQLSTNGTDYVAGDTITISGTDADGTIVSASFVYGTGVGENGTTLGQFVTFLNTQFSQSTATIEPDGKIKLTANATGEAKMTLSFADPVPKTTWTAHQFAVETDGAGPDTATTSIEVFDPAGVGHVLTMKYERQTDGSWTLTTTMPIADGTVVNGTVSGIRFANDGSFLGVQGPTTILQLQFANQPGAQAIDLTFGVAGGFDGVTQTGDDTTVEAKSQDGYAAGTLATLSVNGKGEILGFFTNGQSLTLASIGIANFVNPEGLSREGNTGFAESANSGVVQLGQADNGITGAVRSGVLEASNVDIAAEFVNLIQAQRGFQANARVITATDSLLAELVNIVR